MSTTDDTNLSNDELIALFEHIVISHEEAAWGPRPDFEEAARLADRRRGLLVIILDRMDQFTSVSTVSPEA